jgi:hypothetical protein
MPLEQNKIAIKKAPQLARGSRGKRAAYARKPEVRRSRGRPRGSVNALSRVVKDCIILAGELEGGKEGLVGYLRKVARKDPKTYCALLGRVLPLEVHGSVQATIAASQPYETLEEAMAHCRELGLPDKVIYELVDYRRLPPAATVADSAKGEAAASTASATALVPSSQFGHAG